MPAWCGPWQPGPSGAIFVGFTGTPLLRKDRRMTRDVFEGGELGMIENSSLDLG